MRRFFDVTVTELSPINNIAQTFAHPQAIARQVVEEVDHPRAGRIKLPAAPVMYDGKKLKVREVFRSTNFRLTERPLT